ncbi:serpin family protein [Spirosoma harenae]
MKTTLFSTLSIVITGVLLTAISCKNANVDPGTSTAENLRVSTQFADQTSQFAFDVTKKVIAEEGQAKNVFISPLSLHIALGMIMNGANGQTAQEIQKTLKLDAQTLTEANQTYQNLMENLPGVDSQVKLSLANSVWYRNGFTVENSFQDLLKQSFQAEISAQNFDDAATVGKINNWASEKTNGKIPKVIEQIQPDNVMFLMNALYFKGDWKSKFDPNLTVATPFKLASGTTKNVPMMWQNTELKRSFQPTYTAFELPYGSDKFAMTVLLPAETSTADALVNNLTGADWTQLQKSMTAGTINVGLPKFTLNYEIKLNNALTALGMPTAFTDAADFTKINRNGGLTLSFVKQNTFVAVDEKGTEAAAVTTGGISVTSAPAPVVCNRPFVFVIHEKTSGTILFVGKIADPSLTNS